MKHSSNLAFIPARSGSKGLKDKNIRILGDRPLLAYSIDAAQKTQLFDEVFVSTDSQEYAEIAQNYGASVPFLRSAKTATDNASTWDAVKEALIAYQKNGKQFDTICVLQPTSPFRQAKDISAAYEMFDAKNANCVVSVCEMEHSPLWCNVLPLDNSLTNFLRADIINRPRQTLENYYRFNGAIYIVSTQWLYEAENIYTKNAYAYRMPLERSIDIDTIFDFEYATFLMKRNTSC